MGKSFKNQSWDLDSLKPEDFSKPARKGSSLAKLEKVTGLSGAALLLYLAFTAREDLPPPFGTGLAPGSLSAIKA
jgi:hypothetical protein